MNSDEFKRLYLGEFKPDHMVQEIVAFLRYATDSEIKESRREGLLPTEEYKQAKRILEQAATKEIENTPDNRSEAYNLDGAKDYKPMFPGCRHRRNG